MEPDSVVALRREGIDRLRANAFVEAIALLARAVTAEPNEPTTQLNLGIALQGVDRHAEALKLFASVQKLLPDDPAAFLHAALSFLHLGEASAALGAASDACHRAPELAQAHYAYGQGVAGAERAGAGRARLRGGHCGSRPLGRCLGQSTALPATARAPSRTPRPRCARRLRHAPATAAATANLGAFMRISGEAEAAEDIAARRRSAREPDNAGARLNLAADLLQDERAAEALALLDAAEPPARGSARGAPLAAAKIARAAAARPRRRGARRCSTRWPRSGPIPPELAPLWHWRQVLLASGEGDPPRALRGGGRDGSGAGADGAGRGARAPDHGALRSGQVLVGAERHGRARSRTGRRATRC